MRGMHEAAEAIGFSVACGLSDIEWLSDRLPCILHWNQNHFVVLHKVSHGCYHVADPAKGLQKYGKDEFGHHWLCDRGEGRSRGVVMFLEPNAKAIVVDDDNVGGKKGRSVRFLYKYAREHGRTFMAVAILMLVISLLQAILPFLTQSIVDKGITNKDLEFIWLVLAGQLVITASRTLADFMQRRLLLNVSNRVNLSLVSDFLAKLFRLPMSFFETKNTGDILQRVNDHTRINGFLTQQAIGTSFAILTLVVFASVLLFYSKLIFAIFALGSMLYGAWTLLLLKRRKFIDYEMFDLRAANTNCTFQMVTSMQEIKLQGCERRRRDEWSDTQERLMEYQMRSLKIQQTQEAGGVAMNEVKNAIITIISAAAVIHGELSLGEMLSVQFIIGQLNSPVEQLMGFVHSLQDVGISLERINEVVGKADEDAGKDLMMSFPVPGKGVVFESICFKYDIHSHDNVLENVSLTIPNGKVTAIVGASGSGKTTLMKLLLGYYKAQSGCIEVCGAELGKYSMGWWRSKCGVVMQDGVIFSDTIAGNIASDGKEIDIERIRKAAEMACLSEFVGSLPLGYGTKIGPDGFGLSQGQRQRILIARAIYRDPQFILLDEATNSLDANNERAIVENLGRFFIGRTVIVIAHRLSTVKGADQIVVLEHGKVVEVGSHDTLTESRGAYYKLVKNQLELGN